MHLKIASHSFIQSIDFQVIFGAALVELGLDLLVDKAFIILKVLLYVHFALNHIIEDLLDLRVQFLAQGVRTKSQLFESVNEVSWLSKGQRYAMSGWGAGDALDVGIHLTLLHKLHALI